MTNPSNIVATIALDAPARADQRVWAFDYVDGFGRPASGILVRLSGDAEATEYRAYRNLCPHWSMPLDGGTGEFLDDSGHLIQCKMHGARFEIDTGECILGPCDGEYLEELRVELSADGTSATIRRGGGLRLG
ncbi:Rieske (2Fe-2S) protein [Bradymonas sediminis]|nr:Rieske 2Fe-2S domain-containing protein [Bradymonas sediminis]TDP75286.1 Rieske-like 2Fe-2S protein [Bradymonas sediminis]